MKTLKTILLLSFLLAGSISFAQAPNHGPRGGQQGPPPIPSEKEITNMVSDLADEISLTEDQETQVFELYMAHFEEMDKKTSGNSRPERSEMEAFESTFQNEVKAVLSEPQQTQYDAYLKEQHNNRPRRGSGR
jgi:Spy/CpxP family protein refolding chaperone